ECLLPLRDLTDAGLAVLLLPHPRKGESPVGQASRGSGALPGHVDILIEMGWHGGPSDAGRRRWLRSLSRYEETRRLFLVELTENGTDYQARDAADDEPAAECRQVACLVLEDAEKKLTQREILQQWPEDFPKPDLGSLSRALRRGV